MNPPGAYLRITTTAPPPRRAGWLRRWLRSHLSRAAISLPCVYDEWMYYQEPDADGLLVLPNYERP